MYTDIVILILAHYFFGKAGAIGAAVGIMLYHYRMARRKS